MRIDNEDVRHIALLARVGMTDEEVELMRDQLSNILESFDALQQVDTEGVEPSVHSVELNSIMRADEVSDSSAVEDVLANAPQREGDYVRIRAVLE